MTREPADLDYANVVKRASMVLTRPENLFVLLVGAALLILGTVFSLGLLAGLLGTGFADACAKMAQGQRAVLDDVVWRGVERSSWSRVLAGFILAAATVVGLAMGLVPGMFVLLFSGLVFAELALEPEPGEGMEVVSKVWMLAIKRPVPMIIMGLIASLIGLVLNVVGWFTSIIILTAGVTVAFFFLVSIFVYAHYFGLRSRP